MKTTSDWSQQNIVDIVLKKVSIGDLDKIPKYLKEIIEKYPEAEIFRIIEPKNLESLGHLTEFAWRIGDKFYLVYKEPLKEISEKIREKS